jgi:hypothetical protein
MDIMPHSCSADQRSTAPAIELTVPYRKLTPDMRDLGERCGKPTVVAPNHLQRRFTAIEPSQSVSAHH